jgi:sRNA-binding carbon storage regulator CsrA
MSLENKGRLVLNRREEESIVVSDPSGKELMRIKIYGITRGQTKLAIQAVDEIRIDRLEKLGGAA